MAARKRPAPPPPPPPADSSERSSSSSSDDEQEEEVAQNLSNQKISTENINEAEEESESESESGSDSEPEQAKAPSQAQNTTPSKPAADSGAETEDSEEEEEEDDKPKPNSEPKNEDSKKKQPESEPEKKKQKAIKAERSSVDSKQKGQSSQRLWTPEAELAILRGMVEFRFKNGRLPTVKDFDSISSLRGSVCNDFTSTQLSTKIRNLKGRYRSQMKKKESGVDLDFSKSPHDPAIFEVSEQIWGDESKNLDANGAKESDGEIGVGNRVMGNGVMGNGVMGNGVINKSEYSDGEIGVEENGDEEEHELLYPYLHEAADEWVKQTCIGARQLKRGLMLLDESEARVLNGKFKKQKLREMENYIARMGIDREALRAIVRVLRDN